MNHSPNRCLLSHGALPYFSSVIKQKSKITVGNLPGVMVKLKAFSQKFKEEEIRVALSELALDMSDEVNFESFLKIYLNLQALASAKSGGSKDSSAFLKAATTTILHTVGDSEKACYVAHINSYIGDDPFLTQYLPIDVATDDLFDLAKDGVLLCKLINVAVPGTIDERAINTKQQLNPWERNENHTLCLNSAKAIGCTVVNNDNSINKSGGTFFRVSYCGPYTSLCQRCWLAMELRNLEQR